MFNKAFGVRLLKESVLTFVVTFGTTFLATSDNLSLAAATAGAVAGVRAVVGVAVRNAGEAENSPHL